MSMSQQTDRHESGEETERPSFFRVVLLSAAALILIFLLAYFLVGDRGKKIVPPIERDSHPTSSLRMPAPTAVDV